MSDASARIEAGTLTRGVTYLYRLWVERELGVVPEAYVRREGQATLICPDWALIGSVHSLTPQEVVALAQDLAREVFVICPDPPHGVPSFDVRSQSSTDLPESAQAVIAVLKREQSLLRELGEEDPERDEWWRTRDAGTFALFKGKTCRLILYPRQGEVYGFAVTTGSDGGYFFYRSRSCREDGRRTKAGHYKMSDHALPSGRKVSNLDLQFSGGEVLLLRLLPTGAGFKVFPRRIPGLQGSLD